MGESGQLYLNIDYAPVYKVIYRLYDIQLAGKLDTLYNNINWAWFAYTDV
jgi:hypothetical protein